MADQGTPSRDTEDKDLDEGYDVADNHEEQPSETQDGPDREMDPDPDAESPGA